MVIRVWCHKNTRGYGYRLINKKDQKLVFKVLATCMTGDFKVKVPEVFTFGNLLKIHGQNELIVVPALNIRGAVTENIIEAASEFSSSS